MAITWLKNAGDSGTATINKNNIMLNKTFMNKFDEVGYALVGIDDDENVVIKPLTIDEMESPQYKEAIVFKISKFTNFLRIGNTKCIEMLEDSLVNVKLKGNKFKTIWLENKNCLLIKTDSIIIK